MDDKYINILPLDIKIKIFQMTIKSNMEEWYIDHKKKNNKNILFFHNTDFINKDNPNSRWLCLDDGFPFCDFKNICQKETDETKIKTVYIKDNLNEIIDFRKYSRYEWCDDYWYHEKCRCKTCDYIRICGYNNLDDKQKQKFNGITWEDRFSEQWEQKYNI